MKVQQGMVAGVSLASIRNRKFLRNPLQGFFVCGHKAHFLYGRSVMNKMNPALADKLEKLIHSMGYELIGVELLPQGRQRLFRIYIDKPKGVTVDDCTFVSRQVSAMMDVEDPIPGSYRLEVSSPGIDRPLFAIDHFQKYVGKRVKIRLRSPINQRRQYQGVLKAVQNENIHLLVEGSEEAIILPFSMIEKANLIGDVRL